MKVLIDTNVLISAVLFPNSTPYLAFVKAVSSPNHGFICEQNIDELRRIFNRKFPSHVQALESFLAVSFLTLEVIPMPVESASSESQIRDPKDRPILRAAIASDVDIILTGDKDFLEANLHKPIAMTPKDFLNI